MGPRILIGITSCYVLLATVAGCGGDPAADAFRKHNPDNMRRMISCYRNFQLRNGHKGPKDESEFKEYLQSERARKFMGLIGVDTGNLDATFTNERDGKPFKIRYGVAGSPAGSDDPVIFEETGDGATRLVGFTSGQVREASNEQYTQWLEGSDETFSAKLGAAQQRQSAEPPN